ncbi:hypothetical protein [Thermomonas sp.]|uniref:hypothetical protein n=1 Tax=Thermomonas sp. TaxID=1971895 RepID=UPI00261B1C36|nr:hypothetical protein [Thermomonas sp.]MCO5055461.1 hypothetical protein [Thermomonas sp.]
MTTIDDALKAWDDSYHFKPLRGRKAKLAFTGIRVPASSPKPKRVSGVVAARNRVKGIVRKSPEVMEDFGRRRGMRAIKAHMDYISRNGDVALENEAGEIFHGKEEVRSLRDDWKFGQYGIPEESHQRKPSTSCYPCRPEPTGRPSLTPLGIRQERVRWQLPLRFCYPRRREASACPPVRERTGR